LVERELALSTKFLGDILYVLDRRELEEISSEGAEDKERKFIFIFKIKS